MATLTATDWARAAARTLNERGVDAVRVERLAKQLGVSKGSFYWHFANRDALLDAVLSEWRRLGTQQVIDAVESASGDPRERVAALLAVVTSHPEEDGFEVGVRAWAATDERARAAVVEVDDARASYVRDLLIEAGVEPHTASARADILYRALLGEYLMRHYGTTTASADVGQEIVRLALA